MENNSDVYQEDGEEGAVIYPYHLESERPKGHARLIGIMKNETGGELSWAWLFVIWLGLFILIGH